MCIQHRSTIIVPLAKRAAQNTDPLTSTPGLTHVRINVPTNSVASSTYSDNNQRLLQNAVTLASFAKDISNDRLLEFITQTQEACARLRDGCELDDADIAELKGN